jgi:hypothetical protein
MATSIKQITRCVKYSLPRATKRRRHRLLRRRKEEKSESRAKKSKKKFKLYMIEVTHSESFYSN